MLESRDIATKYIVDTLLLLACTLTSTVVSPLGNVWIFTRQHVTYFPRSNLQNDELKTVLFKCVFCSPYGPCSLHTVTSTIRHRLRLVEPTLTNLHRFGFIRTSENRDFKILCAVNSLFRDISRNTPPIRNRRTASWSEGKSSIRKVIQKIALTHASPGRRVTSGSKTRADCARTPTNFASGVASLESPWTILISETIPDATTSLPACALISKVRLRASLSVKLRVRQAGGAASCSVTTGPTPISWMLVETAGAFSCT